MNIQAQEDSLQHSLRAATFLVVLAYILIYLLPLGIRPLSIPDETRYGEIPHEMITTGDWAVPHLIGLRYFEKPPMGYWLNAISLKVFGENNFAIRFSTALAAGLSAWFVWLLLTRIGYARRNALAAAAVYLSMTEVLIVGTIAVLDTPFSFFLTGGMVLFYLSANDPARRRALAYLIGSGVFFGMAFLTKGFLAIVLPGMVLFVYSLVQKRYILLWRSVLAAIIAVLTILPWALIIHFREPDFWHYFFWEEHIRRFLEPNAQHPEPMYFFVLYLPAMAFPWLAYLPAAIAGLRQRAQNTDFMRYILLWFFLPLIFFSVSRGKLTTYILPIFAPLAAYLSLGIMEYLKTGKTRLFTLGSVINSLLLILLLVAAIYQQYYEPDNPLFVNSEANKLYIMMFCIALTIVLGVLPAILKATTVRLSIIALTIIPLFAFFTLVVPHSTLAGKSPIPMITKVKPLIKPDTIIVTDSNVVRAVAWILKRTDIYLLQKGELTYGLTYPEHKDRYLGSEGISRLLQEYSSGQEKRGIAVFCEEPCQPGLNQILDQHGGKHFSDAQFAVWLYQREAPHE
ncbi:MAG: phospholipid carrier-dependent glycosyltransferase [Gammaproteobacteria bacterium]|nr:phospholipid carrier-dependent glycosyltransferase [Gammaproteobacteria bacterium]